MTRKEMEEKVFEILRNDMAYIHILDSEIRENIGLVSTSVLKAFLEDREQL